MRYIIFILFMMNIVHMAYCSEEQRRLVEDAWDAVKQQGVINYCTEDLVQVRVDLSNAFNKLPYVIKSFGLSKTFILKKRSLEEVRFTCDYVGDRQRYTVSISVMGAMVINGVSTKKDAQIFENDFCKALLDACQQK